MMHKSHETSPVPGAGKGAGKRRETILLVDDDRDFLDLTERMLRKEGYSTVCTDNPQSVLQLARTVRPKAIIVDVLMPGIDGWDVLETLKSQEATGSIPVIMTSILEERQRATEAEAAAFIEKPLTVEKLRSALAALDLADASRAA